MAPNIFPPGTFLSFEEAQRQKATQPTRYTQGGRALIPDLITPGDTASEYSITVENDQINNGRATNIPSIYDGKVVSEEEAIRRVVEANGVDPETGRTLPAFNSILEAETAGKKRSDELGRKMYQPNIQNIFPPGALPSLSGEERPEQTQGMFPPGTLPSLEETNIHDIYPPEEIEADTPIEAETPTEVPEPTDTPTPDPAESQGLLQQFLQNPNIQRALTTGLAGLGAGPYGAIEAGKQFDVRAKTKLEQEERKQERADRERELAIEEAAEKDRVKQLQISGIKGAAEMLELGLSNSSVASLFNLDVSDVEKAQKLGAAYKQRKTKEHRYYNRVTNETSPVPLPGFSGPLTPVQALTAEQDFESGRQSDLSRDIDEVQTLRETIKSMLAGGASQETVDPLLEKYHIIKDRIEMAGTTETERWLKTSGMNPEEQERWRKAALEKKVAPDQNIATLRYIDPETGLQQELVYHGTPEEIERERIRLHAWESKERTENQALERLQASRSLIRTARRLLPFINEGSVGPAGWTIGFLDTLRTQAPEILGIFTDTAIASVIEDINKSTGIGPRINIDFLFPPNIKESARERHTYNSLMTVIAYQLARVWEPQGRLSVDDVNNAKQALGAKGFTSALAITTSVNAIIENMMVDVADDIRTLGSQSPFRLEDFGETAIPEVPLDQSNGQGAQIGSLNRQQQEYDLELQRIIERVEEHGKGEITLEPQDMEAMNQRMDELLGLMDQR